MCVCSVTAPSPPSPLLPCRVTGSYDCTVRVWHASQWHCMHVIHAHKCELSLTCTHQHPGRCQPCSVCVTDSATPLPHTAPVTCVLLDSGQLLSGSWDCSVKVWELETASCVGTLQHPAGVVAMEVRMCTHATCAKNEVARLSSHLSSCRSPSYSWSLPQQWVGCTCGT